jgi:hypothetical protein
MMSHSVAVCHLTLLFASYTVNNTIALSRIR